MEQLLAALQSARVYDLAQPYYPGMPHHPNHPPFLFGLNKKHGDYVARNGASSASEGLTLGGHVGTHIDALCHFSCGGKLHGGEDAADAADLCRRTAAPYRRYHRAHSAARRAAGYRGTESATEALPADFEITPGASGSRRRRGASGGARPATWSCCAPDGRASGTMPRASSRRSTGRVPARPARAGSAAAGVFAAGLRYRGLRESARFQHAGTCSPAGGKRHTHHRVSEPGATRGRAALHFSLRGDAVEDPRRDRIAHPPAGYSHDHAFRLRSGSGRRTDRRASAGRLPARQAGRRRRPD